MYLMLGLLEILHEVMLGPPILMKQIIGSLLSLNCAKLPTRTLELAVDYRVD